MREIKFKYILEIKNSKFIKTFDMEEIEEGCIGEWISESHYDITSKDEHIEYSLQRFQYIGLKDKNGVEIYEGDIVECNIKSQKLWNIRGYFDYQISNWFIHCENGNMHYLNGASSIEVIGNIYENPELLEASK